MCHKLIMNYYLTKIIYCIESIGLYSLQWIPEYSIQIMLSLALCSVYCIVIYNPLFFFHGSTIEFVRRDMVENWLGNKIWQNAIASDYTCCSFNIKLHRSMSDIRPPLLTLCNVRHVYLMYVCIFRSWMHYGWFTAQLWKIQYLLLCKIVELFDLIMLVIPSDLLCLHTTSVKHCTLISTLCTNIHCAIIQCRQTTEK